MNREKIEKAAITEVMKLPFSAKHEHSRINARLSVAFVVGAEWRINSVWHEGNEAPEIDKRVLVCFEDEIGDIYYRIRAFKPYVIKNWGKDYLCLGKVIRWAYIDDLLPGRKEADND